MEEFKDIDDVDPFIAKAMGKILDGNHELMQYSREAIYKLDELRTRMNEIYDDIMEAHAVGAKMIADLSGDMIMNEMGLEKLTHDDPDEDEDLREL